MSIYGLFTMSNCEMRCRRLRSARQWTQSPSVVFDLVSRIRLIYAPVGGLEPVFVI